MGLINHSTLIFNGAPFQDTYVCISNNVIRVSYQKDVNLYFIEIPYTIYYSLEARNNQYGPLMNQILTCQTDTFPADLYNYCYQELKTIYTSYSDV